MATWKKYEAISLTEKEEKKSLVKTACGKGCFAYKPQQRFAYKPQQQRSTAAKTSATCDVVCERIATLNALSLIHI